MRPWSMSDVRRITALRNLTRARALTADERDELRALRRRETIEAFNRRRRMLAA